MKLHAEKLSGETEQATARLQRIVALIDKLSEELPGASRIEIDIEYPDGGRVKIEAREK